MTGTLSVVATPIGNLADITFRAVEVLKNADAILCEDTRVTGKLLKHYEISNKLISYHANSKLSKSDEILEMLAEGKHLALVSDAGTPTISDPGVHLINLVHDQNEKNILDNTQEVGEDARVNNVVIESIPGPTALIAALSLSGFSGNQFTFFGFIPHKKGRETLFKEIAGHDKISIAYESPHRIIKTLESLVEHLDESREVVIARELTKMYEQTIHGSAQEVLVYFTDHPEKIKGEFVIIINI